MSEISRKPQTKYWILFSALLLLAMALILPPLINMSRYQRKIVDAMGNALGRPVHLSSVTLRLLPWPSLELSNFVVEEDPAFGKEPTLHAPSVDAYIRLTSLWRGRLEISRISFDQPSLNLVRDSAGRWNIGTVLLQASRIPNAPTAQRRASRAPRFPYIEASNARVNFKIGNEKTPFSFLDADFAMWLENPSEWNIRVEAHPVRTDLDLGLSDTGLVRVEGSLRRAPLLGDMPINLQAEWSNAPFGQVTRLLLGTDTGWRGNLRLDANIQGSIFNPRFKTRLRIAEIHRQEFTPAESFDVDATCQAAYRHSARALDDLTCLWPIATGHLLMTGSVAEIDHPKPALHLQIQDVPASFGLSALRLLRHGFASSVQVSGLLQGHFAYKPEEGLTGNAAVNGFTFRGPGIDTPLAVPSISIAAAEAPAVSRHRTHPRASAQTPALHLNPSAIALGGTAPLTVSGDFTRRGFSLHFAGEAPLQRLLPLIDDFRLLPGAAAAGLAPQGTASLDLTVHGPWVPQSAAIDRPALPALTEGTLYLQNASYQANFLPDPVQIVSAQASFSPGEITWNPVSVIFHKMQASLTVTAPLQCFGSSCDRTFSLAAPELDAASLQSAIMGAGEHGELLQQILSRLDQNKVQWPALKGTVHTGTFMLGPLTLRNADSSLRVEGRRIQFTSIDGHMLGGMFYASGSMDAASGSPRYSFDAQLLHAAASGLTGLWREMPATGTISAAAHLELTGYSHQDLLQSAQGTFHWDWTQGGLAGGPAALARFDRWSASGSIKDAALQLDRSKVIRGAVKEDVSGTISFNRKMNLKLDESASGAHLAQTTGPHAP